MKRIIPILISLTLFASCSVRVEKRLYNKGFYVQRSGAGNTLASEPATVEPPETVSDIRPSSASQNINSYNVAVNDLLTTTGTTDIKESSFPAKKRKKHPFIDPAIPQDDSEKVLIVNPLVGEIIDGAEKEKHNLFSFWSDNTFLSARFIEKKGQIFLEGTMKSGEVKLIPYTEQQYNKVNTQIASSVSDRKERDALSDDLELALLIALYVVLGLALIAALSIICIFMLVFLGGTIFYASVILSLALIGIVLQAMRQSIEDRTL
jgi:hypothetical protein